MILTTIICLAVGYMFGCFSTAYIIGKLNNIDIRSYGSGNAGTTNAMRTLGKSAGIMTYIGDAIKTIIPVLLMGVIFDGTAPFRIIALITGFGVVLGHNYPFWLNFKGGKGIAVTSAVIILYCPPMAIVYLLIFALIVGMTKYVSVGSLIITIIFLIHVILTNAGTKLYILSVILGLLFCLSAFYAHRLNIVRLINGTENKIGSKKK